MYNVVAQMLAGKIFKILFFALTLLSYNTVDGNGIQVSFSTVLINTVDGEIIINISIDTKH